MQTTRTALLLICLLTACSAQNKADKNDVPANGSKNTAVGGTNDPSYFSKASLAYPGSSISFNVETRQDSLFIHPSGLTVTNETLRHDITGYTVTNAEIGDLNTDGYPELFVYLASDSSGCCGKLIGYSVNNGKSVSRVFLPEIAENERLSNGYMGHDEMAIVESTFCRRFPIYNEGDSNGTPTGGTRQIQYKLVDGQSGRVLKVDKVLEF